MCVKCFENKIHWSYIIFKHTSIYIVELVSNYLVIFYISLTFEKVILVIMQKNQASKNETMTTTISKSAKP